ncbi:DUF1819 family protein [Propionivibrio sp.]|uniref:DUF1819 family protein n=1 Tax=Propionivibrio sp. TaxID=2212460 RepID=UPI003BF0626B
MPLYNAEISAGSMMFPESRRVARLLLTHPSKEQWFEALKLDNILQKKTPATARRQARLIRNRLDTLEDEAWSLIADGSQEVATQLLFAAAIKHSRVLADFLRDVYAGHLRRLEQNLSPTKDWEAFLAECVQRDPEVANFSDSTKAKMLQVVLRVLAEGKYLESTKTLRLTPPHLHPDVVRYLKRHGETTVLSTMDMTQ